ncbi:MAG: hypothetical protein ACRBBP_03200 [Bdellovibrionales bacterium]
MKILFYFAAAFLFRMELARALTCKSLLSPAPTFGQNYNPDFLEIEGSSFIYLTTLLQTRIQNPNIDQVDHVAFRLKALGKENLLGVRIDNEEGRRVFTELLKFSYRSLSREELKLGRSLFKDYRPLDESELLAKALIEFTLGERGYNLSNRANAALRMIGKTSSPKAMWYKAEMHSRIGNFVSAQNLLVHILSENSTASLKVNIALAFTQTHTHRPLPKKILNRLDEQKPLTKAATFDYSNWGSYSN